MWAHTPTKRETRNANAKRETRNARKHSVHADETRNAKRKTQNAKRAQTCMRGERTPTRDNTCRHPPSSLDVTTQYRLSSHRLGPVEFHSVLPRYVGSCCLVVAREKGPRLLRTSFVRRPSSLPTLHNRTLYGTVSVSLLIAECMPCSRRCLTRYLVITRGPDPFGSKPRLSSGPQGTGRVTHRKTYTTTAPHFPE